MVHVNVNPELLSWACERAGRDVDALSQKQPFHKLPEWMSGKANPTFKQLEKFAKATYTPFGYFFLPKPPKESVPISDLRTAGNTHIGQPSPDLLDTVFICQQRQEWYRNFAKSIGEKKLPFVGSADLQSEIIDVAKDIQDKLNFNVEERIGMQNWDDALRQFISQADSLGILVMTSGIVGNNTKRPLNPKEFRGFALSDPLAPLIFINGKDTKAAKIFTLAHEMAHIWLGETALSDIAPITEPSYPVEIWCNKVAAELLVPVISLEKVYLGNISLREELDSLARCFKVSTLIILRRLHDAGKISKEELWSYYHIELERLRGTAGQSGGRGNFYLTLPVRVSKRFAKAIIASTLEGQTLHRDALRLLGISKISTFHELGHQIS